MPFGSATLARRIEAAEARLIGDFARRVEGRWPRVLIAAVGDATAVWVGDAQPFNKLVGLGLGTPVDEGALAGVEGAFDERNAPLQLELATLADGAAAALLSRRGYELTGFENVLGLDLAGELAGRLAALVESDRAAGVRVERVTADAGPAWVDTVVTGFAQADVFDGPAASESFPREMMVRDFEHLAELPGYACYLARRDGAVAGGGSLRMLDGIAQLNGAATLSEHRRRGVQSAVLRARLLDAARNGCDLAVVTTQPGSKSMENALRAGFTLLYARAILVRPSGGRR